MTKPISIFSSGQLNDPLSLTLEYFTGEELTSIGLVCKNFLAITNKPIVWKKLLERSFSIQFDGDNPKQKYIAECQQRFAFFKHQLFRKTKDAPSFEIPLPNNHVNFIFTHFPSEFYPIGSDLVTIAPKQTSDRKVKNIWKFNQFDKMDIPLKEVIIPLEEVVEGMHEGTYDNQFMIFETSAKTWVFFEATTGMKVHTLKPKPYLRHTFDIENQQIAFLGEKLIQIYDIENDVMTEFEHHRVVKSSAFKWSMIFSSHAGILILDEYASAKSIYKQDKNQNFKLALELPKTAELLTMSGSNAAYVDKETSTIKVLNWKSNTATSVPYTERAYRLMLTGNLMMVQTGPNDCWKPDVGTKISLYLVDQLNIPLKVFQGYKDSTISHIQWKNRFFVAITYSRSEIFLYDAHKDRSRWIKGLGSKSSGTTGLSFIYPNTLIAASDQFVHIIRPSDKKPEAKPEEKDTKSGLTGVPNK